MVVGVAQWCCGLCNTKVVVMVVLDGEALVLDEGRVVADVARHDL